MQTFHHFYTTWLQVNSRQAAHYNIAKIYAARILIAARDIWSPFRDTFKIDTSPILVMRENIAVESFNFIRFLDIKSSFYVKPTD